MMVNLLMVVLLLRWPLAFSLALTGTSLAILFFKHRTNTALPVSTSDGPLLRIACGLLIFMSFLAAFVKGKKAYLRLVTSNAQLNTEHSFINQLILTIFKHRTAVLKEVIDCSLMEDGITNELEEPEEKLHTNTTKEHLHAKNGTLHRSIYQLGTYNRYLKQVLHRIQQPLSLEVQAELFDVLWQKSLEEVCKDINPVIVKHHTDSQRLHADITAIQRLLRNALTYTASQQHNKQAIWLGFENTQLAYPVISSLGTLSTLKHYV